MSQHSTGRAPSAESASSNRSPASTVVAGVDVGGRKKGFHAVALRGGTYLDQTKSTDATEIAAWCRSIGASLIGVDAPCRWSETGRARPAERELMKEGIWCFSTPSQRTALNHPRGHFDWMLRGEALFGQLERHYPLLLEVSLNTPSPRCFETFPQAVACALAGSVVSAKQKRHVRRSLLTRAGVDARKLTSIDAVDAALCALSAHYLFLRRVRCYGDGETGLIVVPSIRLAN